MCDCILYKIVFGRIAVLFTSKTTIDAFESNVWNLNNGNTLQTQPPCPVQPTMNVLHHVGRESVPGKCHQHL